ncbi:hypothetical protein [Luteolibacter marinus]|uniref:hypothetical protein n=1 Tax=Luteolibacter marinus TaxID=2776705 RepID=UPI0018693CBB|nr:hypothetical protein [Luteolibacter marinus]
MNRSPFATFERSLSAEARQKQAADIEAGKIEAPRPRPRQTRKRKRPSPGESANLYLSPRVTAAAAITAEREGVATHEVLRRWTLAAALEDRRPVIDPGVSLAISLVIGSNALPEDLFLELAAEADRRGIAPATLALQAIREGLAPRR